MAEINLNIMEESLQLDLNEEVINVSMGQRGEQGPKGEPGAQGETGSQGPAGTDGESAFIYIAYASDDQGGDFTLTFDPDLDYIAILTTDAEIAVPLASDFAGLWKYYGGGFGDVTGPLANSDNYVPQWNGADSKTLKNGLAVGSAANNLVQLDGSAKLPAVDGSQLTNLPNSGPGGGDGEMQFNDGGELAGAANVIYDKVNCRIGVGSFPSVYDEYTKLMLHMEGSGNSFMDSALGKTITTHGDVTQSSSQYKFGSKSGFFDGAGDYVQMTYDADFDFSTSAFTIDFWVYPTSNARQGIFAFHTDSHFGLMFSRDGNGELNLFASSNGFAWDLSGNDGWGGTAQLSLNEWNHVAVIRNGSNWRVYVNGAVKIEATNSANLNNRNETFDIGRWGNTPSDVTYFAGYIDEFRISKGIARWISDFTPPASAYTPDSVSIDEALQVGDVSADSTPAIKLENDAVGIRLVVDGADGDKIKLQETTDSNAAILEVEPGTQVVTFGAMPVTPGSAPANNYEIANKKYVDDQAGGVQTELDSRLHDPVNSDPNGSLSGSAGQLVVWMDSGTPKFRVCTGGTAWTAF